MTADTRQRLEPFSFVFEGARYTFYALSRADARRYFNAWRDGRHEPKT